MAVRWRESHRRRLRVPIRKAGPTNPCPTPAPTFWVLRLRPRRCGARAGRRCWRRPAGRCGPAGANGEPRARWRMESILRRGPSRSNAAARAWRSTTLRTSSSPARAVCGAEVEPVPGKTSSCGSGATLVASEPADARIEVVENDSDFVRRPIRVGGRVVVGGNRAEVGVSS